MSLTMTVSRPAASPFRRFRWEEAARIWGDEAAPLGQAMLRSHAPFRTGQLRQDIRFRQETSAGLHLIVYYATVPQAKFVLYGTKAHGPVHAKAMRFQSRAGGVVYAKWVRGVTPNPFPEKALKPIRTAISLMFAKAIEESMHL